MALRLAPCLLGLWAVGCADAPGAPGVDLTLAFDQTVSDARLGSAERLAFTVQGDEAATFELVLTRALLREERLVYRPAGSSRHIRLSIAALASGQLVASGSTPELTLPDRGEIAVTVMMRGQGGDEDLAVPQDGGAIDLPPPPDGSSPTCNNGVLDGDETGPDCGGSCLYCTGKLCASNAECASGVCDGVCVHASSPPFWTDGPMLESPRSYHAAAQRADGKVVIAGGTSTGASSGLVATAELLDYSGTSGLPSMTTPRYFLAMAADTAGNVYAIGGADSLNAPLSAAEKFNGTAWSGMTMASNLHAQHAAARLDDDHIAIVDSSGNEVYSILGNSWSPIDTFIGSRDSNAALRGGDGKIYDIGGYDYGASVDSKRVQIYNAPDNTWSDRASMAQARVQHGAALGPDGRIYVVGGFSGVALASVEAYQSVPDRWTSKVAAIAEPRWALAVAQGPDGRIYALGGLDKNSTTLQSTVAYGPIVFLPIAAVSVGNTVEVRLSNFASSARGQVKLDDAVVATYTTDSSGFAITGFVVPSGTSAQQHTISARDSRSGYPVSARLLVN